MFKEGFFGNFWAKHRLEKITPGDTELVRELLLKSKKKGGLKLTEEETFAFDDVLYKVNEIIAYNEKCANEFDEIQFDEKFLTSINEIKKAIEIKNLGSVGKYNREKLRQLINMTVAVTDDDGNRKELVGVFPKGFDTEAELMNFFPEDYNRKLPAEGGWIMIKDVLPISEEFVPPKWSIFFAVPISVKGMMGLRRWKAEIIYNDEKICVLPREYVVVPDINEILEMIDKEFTMNEIGSAVKLDKSKVFYLESRGMSRAEVYRTLFKDIKSRAFCYFEAMENTKTYFEMVQSGMRHETAVFFVNKQLNTPEIVFEK